jgi:membrane protease YdiL (CAAX protease family)
VRIPLGTALLEEVAFRGVLYGAWLRIASPVVAAVGASAVFGLWHIVPTLELMRTNVFGGNTVMRSAAVGAGIAATAIGGLLFVALREWTGGIAGPIVVHTAANSFATVAAYIWQRT